MKVNNFDDAMKDCKRALMQDPKNAKAYNKLSKCHIASGDLVAASIALQKSLELEPQNPSNKKDHKVLSDLKITESLVKKAVSEGMYEKAVTNLTQLLESCTEAVNMIVLKIECLMKAFNFEEADKYSAKIIKKGDHIANNPKVLCIRGKVLIYTGNDVLGKKFL